MMKNWKRNITFFIAGQMISFVGSLLVQYAIFWYINLETESGTILTISIIASLMKKESPKTLSSSETHE